MGTRNEQYPDVQKGRGAPSNGVSQRFNLQDREIDGDWLDERDRIDDAAARLRTEVTIPNRSSITTHLPTCRSTVRSTPIAAANMAASIVMRDRPMPIMTCHLVSILKASCSPNPMPPTCFVRPLPNRTTSRPALRSAPTPIPISRSRSATGSRGRYWK